MHELIALIRKDLIIFMSDRRALLLTLMMPVVLGAFFGYLFGGSGSNDGQIELALVQEDQSEVSDKIAFGIKADSALHVQNIGLAEAQVKVRKGKLGAAIVIPAGFGDAAGEAFFGKKAKPEITIYYDPSQAAVLAMVKGILTQHVMQTVSAEMFGGKGGQKMVDGSLKDLEVKSNANPANADLNQLLQSVKKFQQQSEARAAANPGQPSTASSPGLSTPFITKDQAMSAGPKYNAYGHAFAGMCVQFILFLGIDVGIGMLLARRLGIWNRLLAAPVTFGTLLLARALSSALMAFGLLCFVFLFAVLVFKVEIAGSLPGFLGVGACFSLMTACFGLLIAAFGKTPEAARGIAIFATLMMVMLGGAWVPAFLFPQWMQTLTLAVPTRWAVDGLDLTSWRGQGLEAALPAMAVLLGFTLVFGALALWKFKSEEE
jgi:ABC-2 type transport system permease protein